jgi:Acetoacetate decarboxylase (ADC)
MAFDPKPGSYYRMPIFFGPTPGPRQYPEGLTIDWNTTPKKREIAVSFLTDADRLQAFLPSCFELWGEPVVTVRVWYLSEIAWLAGRGYNMCDVEFPAIYKGRNGPVHGNLVLVRWEDLADPIISGREELGHNKLYCEIPVARALHGHYSTEMSWLHFPFLKVEVWDLQEDLQPPPADPLYRGMLSYKYMPRTGQWGVEDLAYATLSPPARHGRVLKRFKGAGKLRFADTTWDDMPTQHHVINALASLPIHEIRAASLLDSEGGASGSETRILD